MADLTITIPEPTETTDGIMVIIRRDSTSTQVHVNYERSGITKIATLKPSDLTPAQRNQAQAFVQMVLGIVKPVWGF